MKEGLANLDIDTLLREGSSPCQVSEILGVRREIVIARVAFSALSMIS